MNRVKLINYLLVLGIMATFKTAEPCEKRVEIKTTILEEDIEKESYSLSELNLLSICDEFGTIHYYFAIQKNKEYQAITNPRIAYKDTIFNLKETGYYWIPDKNKPVCVISVIDFFLLNDYDTEKMYTIEELKTIEEEFSSILFNPFLRMKESTFPIEDLFMVGDGNHISMYNKNCCLELEENKKTSLYYYDLLDLKMGLKCYYEIQENMEKEYVRKTIIEKITALYSLEKESREFYTYDVLEFLTEEQKARGFLYYEEIESIIEEVNPKIKPRMLLA